MPFAEDEWRAIRIGDVEFDVVKPCERCIFTTVDPLTGRFRPSQANRWPSINSVRFLPEPCLVRIWWRAMPATCALAMRWKFLA